MDNKGKKFAIYNATARDIRDTEGILGKTVMHVLSTISELLIEETDEPASADIILGASMGSNCPGFDVVKRLYSKDQMFLVISLAKDAPEVLPENIKWIYFENAVIKLLKFLNEYVPQNVHLKRCIELQPATDATNPLHLLVVDDKNENLQGAVELLGKYHFLTLAGGYDEGLRMIQKNKYDIVLADCQMPPGKEKSSLSFRDVKIGDTVHNGIFLIFPATQKGARFAIVTDANHHQDWVSAIFDQLREPQVVNGQPVLFINYMGKNWGRALEKLQRL